MFRLPERGQRGAVLAGGLVREHLLLCETRLCGAGLPTAAASPGEVQVELDPGEGPAAAAAGGASASAAASAPPPTADDACAAGPGAEAAAFQPDDLEASQRLVEEQEALRRRQEEEDAALAAALDTSLNETGRRDRPGQELSLPGLAQLGVAFERQPDGSDSCAIHSLNNIVQPFRSPEEAADISAARVAAAVATEQGEAVLLEGVLAQGPFTLQDLQDAEAEVRREERHDEFLPLATTSLLLLRADSGQALGQAPARTGMFEVEAVKVAARNKGYEVIEVEPTPCWAEPECGARCYAEAARELDAQGGERWLLGFLVYERIPGRAMHYYVIVRVPGSQVAGAERDEAWVVLDGLDRGPKSPRNRLLTPDELVAFYDRNGEWFRSWLVRWYPVVDHAAAVQTVSGAVTRGALEACGAKESEAGLLRVSPDCAKAALEGERWEAARAARRLLSAVAKVDRELQVLQLAVSEGQARSDLERAGWDFALAVRTRSEQMLQQCWFEVPATAEGAAGAEPPGRWIPGARFGGALATYLALHFANWDARSAALVLLLAARAQDAAPPSDPRSGESGGGPSSAELRMAGAALEACGWDLDRGLAVFKLCREQHKRQEDCGTIGLSEAECAVVLESVRYDAVMAERLLDVRRSFPRTPPKVCAEALRRGDGNVPAACALLQEFEERVRAVALRVIRAPESKGWIQESEVDELYRPALDLADWNPAVAFAWAESIPTVVVHALRELAQLENQVWQDAKSTVDRSGDTWEQPQATQGTHGSSGSKSAPPSEAEVAAALHTLDAVTTAKGLRPSAAEVLAALQEAAMDPATAAALLFHRRTGLGPKSGEKLKSPRPPTAARAPAPREGEGPPQARVPSKQRKPGGPGERRTSAGRGKQPEAKASRSSDCSVM